MTTPRKHTESTMIELLREKYTKIRAGTDADRYVRVEKPRKVRVYSGGYTYTGDATRIADYLVVDTYGTTEIIGFEVKISRSDWLTELKDPSKSEEWRAHCHRWYLVVPDATIVRDDLPEGWGLMTIDKNGKLRVRVKSVVNPEPEPLDSLSQAQLYRSVAKTARREERSRHGQGGSTRVSLDNHDG